MLVNLNTMVTTVWLTPQPCRYTIDRNRLRTRTSIVRKKSKGICGRGYVLMTYAGVTHGDLYHGNMRFDVNISVAPEGATEPQGVPK